jgi:hypothetical protein
MTLPKQLYRTNRRLNRLAWRFSVWWATGLRLNWRRWRRATTRRERIRPGVEIVMRLAIAAVIVYAFYLVVR